MSPKTNAPARILVVDDNAENRRLFAMILDLGHYAVDAVGDGLAALDHVRASPPDLILLDVMMPGLDGYEVCRRLKADPASRDIPVIFATSLGDQAAETRSFEAGGVDFLNKPVHPQVVLARVAAQLALAAQRRNLEGMFRDVVEFAPDAIILTDLDGHVTQVNARTEELFGWPRAELFGQPVERLMPQQPGSTNERRLRDHDRAPGMLRMASEATCLRRDGSEFFGDVTLSTLHPLQGPLLMAVVRDVTESRRIQQEVITSRQRLRDMAAQSEAVREYERKNIAREVHDELGQVLTALRMDLTYLDLRHGGQAPELQAKLRDMRGLVDRAIQGVRNVAANLRPTALDMGLIPAIDWVCSEFSRNTGIPCAFASDGSAIDLPEARAIGLFRIVQESLTNVTRYAQARAVRVTLQCQGETLVLEVRDDGRGFDPAQATRRNSFGLLGMQERALALGGLLEVLSAPGQGACVSARIPLHQTNPWQAPA